MSNYGLITLEGLPAYRFDMEEARLCETIGSMRYQTNLGRKNSYNLSHDGRDEEVVGAYGEYAVSQWLNLAWKAVVRNPWQGLLGDVGELQVRTTFNARDPHLICHPRDESKSHGAKGDKDDAVFVLVSRQEWDLFRIEGWATGRHAKQEQWYGDKYNKNRPAYFVPANQLWEPNELRRRVWKKITDDLLVSA